MLAYREFNQSAVLNDITKLKQYLFYKIGGVIRSMVSNCRGKRSSSEINALLLGFWLLKSKDKVTTIYVKSSVFTIIETQSKLSPSYPPCDIYKQVTIR